MRDWLKLPAMGLFHRKHDQIKGNSRYHHAASKTQRHIYRLECWSKKNCRIEDIIAFIVGLNLYSKFQLG